uniref:N-acetyltransferase domain-containing protein n=1 Tax=Anopheles quadriannulatus TaxID=34691 RepID=A0A182X6P9_ANOQN
MEHTPRNAVRQGHRGALLGTPKLASGSSSKKSLFGKDAADETDLGPMTPLRFGSHRKKGQTPHSSSNALTNITSFRNLFGNESPDSDRSLSPDFARRFTNNGRYELLSVDQDKENVAMVDEETRFSFSSSIPETPSSRLSAEESALLDENNSNSLSLMMSSDLNLVEKRTKALHRTPGVTTRSRSTNRDRASVEPLQRRTQQQAQPQHQPKAQLLGVKRPHTVVSTPDNRSQSPVCTEPGGSSSTAKRPNVKARTALHFNDVQPIPAKSFYSSASVAEKDHSPLKPLQPLSTKSFYSSATSLAQGPTSTSAHKSTPSPKRSTSHHQPVTPKHVPLTKTPHKATMRKRSKSFSSAAPRLGQRGTVHKIRKPSKKRSPKEARTDRSRTPKGGGSAAAKQTKNRAIAGGTKSCPTTPKSNKQPDHEQMLQQLKRVNSILREGQRNLKRAARPLVTSRSMTDLAGAGLLSESEGAGSSSSEEEGSASEGEEEDGGGTQRKFFRSKRRSRSIRSVYKHFDTIMVGVKQGGKRKLLSFPQPPKRRRTAFGEESFDFAHEQAEVEDLISKLGDGGSDSFGEGRANDEDDAPIPIQSNVIYLSAGDGFVVEHSPAEGDTTMEALQADCENGMVVVQHGGSEITEAVLHEANNYSTTFDGYDQLAYDGESMYDGVEQRTDFLSNSTIIIQHDTYHTTSTIYHNESAASTTVVQNSTVSHYQCQTQCQSEQPMPTDPTTNAYYPIFYPDRVKELWREERQQTLAAEQQTADVRHLLRQQPDHRAKADRAGAGHNQYQIDAGQRVYGAVHCKECGLTYTTHEPEEELFHDRFHRSQAQLSFPSGLNEQVVVQVPEWDVTGRIVVVSQVDSTRQPLLRKAQSVLELVDGELGYATCGELPEGACVYLAVARSTVLGICVVQPLQYANRMICLDGLHGVPIDCYSSEFYHAKCGISRIWVAPKYRRKGVGRKLVAAVRYHYIFGYTIAVDEIAFGAPTEMGKLFAESVCGRKDFLVYV